MDLVVDELHRGTDEQTWLASDRLHSLSPLRLGLPRRLVLVAPHPDDEVLGAGGLLQCMHHLRVEVVVVAVTDGEGSHPAARAGGRDVASTRATESAVALDRLGCGSAPIMRLGLSDGSVAAELPRLTRVLSDLLGPDDLCVTPWRHDGHPDHDATGAATVAAAGALGTPVLEYPIWAWHWASPESAAIPWNQCRRLDLGWRRRARKRWATYAFTSQIRPLHGESRPGPILTDAVLRRFWRPFEVFIEAGI